MTLWDDNYFDLNKLEKWLYGKQSLEGATRRWLIERAKEWSYGVEFLDAGCGGGVTAYQLEQAGILNKIKYTGVDFSKCMLDLAQKKIKHPNTHWICSPLEGFDSKNEFDRVLLRAVLEHSIDPVPILANALRALKKTGLLYIVFWNNPVSGKMIVEKTPEGFYDISHSRETLTGVIKERGLQILKQLSIEEQAKNGDHRDIWVIGR